MTKHSKQAPKKPRQPKTKDTTNAHPPFGWDELAAILHSREKEITLVVGAGIHCVPKWERPLTYERGRLLSSWSALLDSISPKIPQSPSPILRWELALLQQHSDEQANEQANERNSAEFSKLQQTVIAAESEVLDHQCQYDLVKAVIAASCVENIISLNFDLTIEHLLLKSGEPFPSVARDDAETNIADHLGRRRKTGRCVIWHPHGDRESSEGSCIGLREYALRAKDLEDARDNYKKAERTKTFVASEPRTWIDLIMSTNVIFVGTSLDFSEWDIWFALVNRWRNYAKPDKKQYEPKTFVLTTGDRHASLPNQFTRLSAPDYEQGWKWLGAVMNGSNNSPTSSAE